MKNSGLGPKADERISPCRHVSSQGSRTPDGSSSPGYNWRCRIGLHRWRCWSKIDVELGTRFDFMWCDRPDCKWAGLTWVQTEKL